MPRLRRQNRLCSSNVSDTANRLLKRTASEGSPSVAEEKSSAVPPFRSGHMSAICARLGSKGKVGVQRGRETAGVPSFLPPPRGAARSRRPQTANPPLRFSGKLPARKGRTCLRQFECPAGSVQKRSRPLGANTLTQFAHPGFPVQKRSRPLGANPPAAVRVPRSTGAGKCQVQPAIKIFKKICVTLLQNTRK